MENQPVILVDIVGKPISCDKLYEVLQTDLVQLFKTLVNSAYSTNQKLSNAINYLEDMFHIASQLHQYYYYNHGPEYCHQQLTPLVTAMVGLKDVMTRSPILTEENLKLALAHCSQIAFVVK